jgi:hypothetical protein
LRPINSRRIASARSSCRTIRNFANKLKHIVGLYVDPPDHAVVLSADEKSQIQELDRTQPGLPMKPGLSSDDDKVAFCDMAAAPRALNPT